MSHSLNNMPSAVAAGGGVGTTAGSPQRQTWQDSGQWDGGGCQVTSMGSAPSGSNFTRARPLFSSWRALFPSFPFCSKME